MVSLRNLDCRADATTICNCISLQYEIVEGNYSSFVTETWGLDRAVTTLTQVLRIAPITLRSDAAVASFVKHCRLLLNRSQLIVITLLTAPTNMPLGIRILRLMLRWCSDCCVCVCVVLLLLLLLFVLLCVFVRAVVCAFVFRLVSVPVCVCLYYHEQTFSAAQRSYSYDECLVSKRASITVCALRDK